MMLIHHFGNIKDLFGIELWDTHILAHASGPFVFSVVLGGSYSTTGMKSFPSICTVGVMSSLLLSARKEGIVAQHSTAI
jgi:hypothetical protein